MPEVRIAVQRPLRLEAGGDGGLQLIEGGVRLSLKGIRAGKVEEGVRADVLELGGATRRLDRGVELASGLERRSQAVPRESVVRILRGHRTVGLGRRRVVLLVLEDLRLLHAAPVLVEARVQVGIVLGEVGLRSPVVLHVAGGLIGDAPAEQPGHGVQRSVDSGGNARGGDDRAVVDEAASVDDDRFRRLTAKAVDRAVEGRDLLAVQEAQLRDGEGARAHGERHLGLGLHGLQPRHELRVVEEIVGVPPGDHDDVGFRRVVDRVLRLHLEESAVEGILGARDRIHVERALELAGAESGRCTEDLSGACEIEELDAFVEHDRDVAGVGSGLFGRGGGGRRDQREGEGGGADLRGTIHGGLL
jgi:hypothetical protein